MPQDTKQPRLFALYNQGDYESYISLAYFEEYQYGWLRDPGLADWHASLYMTESNPQLLRLLAIS